MSVADKKNFGQNFDLTVPIKKCPNCNRGYRVQIGEVPKDKVNFISTSDSDPVIVNLSMRKPSDEKTKIIENCDRIYFKCNFCGK